MRALSHQTRCLAAQARPVVAAPVRRSLMRARKHSSVPVFAHKPGKVQVAVVSVF